MYHIAGASVNIVTEPCAKRKPPVCLLLLIQPSRSPVKISFDTKMEAQ